MIYESKEKMPFSKKKMGSKEKFLAQAVKKMKSVVKNKPDLMIYANFFFKQTRNGYKRMKSKEQINEYFK